MTIFGRAIRVCEGPSNTWPEWGKNTFTEAVLEIFVYDVRLSPETRDPEILERATVKLIP